MKPQGAAAALTTGEMGFVGWGTGGRRKENSVWKAKLTFKVTSDLMVRLSPPFTVLESFLKQYRQGEQSPSFCPV